MQWILRFLVAVELCALSTGPAVIAWADPGNGATGNSGTIKISAVPLASATMANDPHPPCVFYILGFALPSGSGTYSITPQPPNGSGPAGSTTSRSAPIAYSNGASTPYPVLVHKTSRSDDKGFDLQIGPIADLAAGQYKVSVDSSASRGGAKQKVFRVECSPVEQKTETVHVEKTADTSTLGLDQLIGEPFTFKILITRDGPTPTATVRAVDDLRAYCPLLLSIDEVTTDGVGFASTVDNCVVTIVGDAQATVGTTVNVTVHLLPQALTEALAAGITNSVGVEVLNAPGTPTATAQVTVPIVIETALN